MGTNESFTFTFEKIPANVGELKGFAEASLDTPYKTAALALIALCNFESNKDATFEMLDFLNGPEDVSVYTKQFITDRLRDKYYKTFSFFAGATPDNNYKADSPYSITVSSNPYSFTEENRATLYVKSSGADSERPISLRKKTSTGEWFVTAIDCLADIRVPVSADPWA